MFAPILNWMMGTAGRGSDRTLDTLSTLTAEKRRGEEILSAVPRGRERSAEIEDLMIGLPRQDRPELVGRAILRFALYVVDLPASEKNHDSRDYGLLDHSLDVARAAVGDLVRPSFRVSEDPAANYREQPVWAYAGFVLGLLHDVGKVLEVEVKGAPNREPWNPLKEPLASYLEHGGRKTSGPDLRRWKPGRGRNEHVWKGQALFPLVLPESSRALLGGRLGALLEVFTRSYGEGSENWHQGPEGRIVKIVRGWDKALAKEDSVVTQQRIADVPVKTEKPKQNGIPHEEKPLDEAPEEVVRTPEIEMAEGQADEGLDLPEAGKAVASAPPTYTQAQMFAREVRPPEKKPSAPASKQSEHEHRLQVELDPARLIETIRGWIRSGNVSRNRPSAHLFVSPKFLWLRYPQAFETILRGVDLNWSHRVGDRLLRALKDLPQVDRQGLDNVLVPAFPSPQTPKPAYFVRLRAVGFLPEEELALLGQWPFEMRILPATPPCPQNGTEVASLRKAV